MAERTYTEAELRALLAKATGTSDLDAIASRPYTRILHADGSVMCFPPSEGGPLTVGGQHPTDYYGADDKGVATKNAGDEKETAKAATAADTAEDKKEATNA